MIRGQLEENTDYRLLRTIPGVGAIIALEGGDLRRQPLPKVPELLRCAGQYTPPNPVCSTDVKPSTANFPTVQWATSPCNTPNCNGTVGTAIAAGTVLGMPRPDGYAWGVGTFQGTRTFDSSAGTWTSPDAYGGDIHDPMTQKSYMWSGNNGVAYADPSGYDAVSQGLDGGGGQTLFTDWSMTGMAGYDNPMFGNAMQQVKVPNVQQPVQGSSGQAADPADQAPSKVIVAGSQVVNGGAQTNYTYKLENAESQPLVGGGYTVAENITPSEHTQNTNGIQQPVNKDGTFGPDEVGWDKGDVPSGTATYRETQTFTATYQNKLYNLTTVFLHTVTIVNGVVTSNTITVEHP